MSDEYEVTFRKPTEQQAREADPFADQAAYQRYWEQKYLERRINAQRNTRGLSIYERARLRPEDGGL
jgi:hypothetical protein